MDRIDRVLEVFFELMADMNGPMICQARAYEF
jgi:hypothetical protein